jgi:poly(3-hydroxybutyrate) depolymerase
VRDAPIPYLLKLGLALLLGLLPAAGRAQYAPTDRFELGRRLHAFESAWDLQPDHAARKRAIPFLNAATRSFLFSSCVDEIARDLDEARFALRATNNPEPAVLWAESLTVRPAFRLLDTAAGELPVALSSYYAVKAAPPEAARLRLVLKRADGRPALPAVESVAARVPCDAHLSLHGVTEGDYTLRSEVVAGGRVLAYREQTVSLVRDLNARLGRLREAAGRDARRTDADVATLRSRVDLLTALRHGETLETNSPAARLLREAEAVAATDTAGRRYYGSPRVGEFRLTLPVARGTTAVRLMAPDAVRQGQPRPLVLALHGAGGSENWFFEAYGGGAIVRCCRERGWLLAAPRGGLFDLTPPLPELVDAVARLYPVDRRRVFVVGHSLGAIQAVNCARRTPRIFAAVAALAGSLAGAPSPEMRDVPVFIGTGAEDPILRDGSRHLFEALDRAGAGTLLFRRYEDTEHLTVVAAALDDVFAFFDRAGR